MKHLMFVGDIKCFGASYHNPLWTYFLQDEQEGRDTCSTTYRCIQLLCLLFQLRPQRLHGLLQDCPRSLAHLDRALLLRDHLLAPGFTVLHALEGVTLDPDRRAL